MWSMCRQYAKFITYCEMITFQQLCEHLTSNQRNAWFLFAKEHFVEFTEQEASQVYVEYTNDGLLRLWYPKEKFYTRIVYREEFTRLLQKALEKEDFAEVLKLKQMIVKD